MKKNCSLKLNRYLDKNSIYRDHFYTGLVTIFTYFVLIFDKYIYIYIYDDLCLLQLPLHVFFFFFSLYTHVSLCMQFLFLFHTWCLDEFCLSVSEKQVVKIFHAMNSFLAKFFQEFIVGIDLFYNTISGYEFSNLRLFSWLFVLLWFCHGLPKWKIVKDIFYVIG